MNPSSSPERAAQIRTLFGAALDLDPDDRAAALDQACPDDPALRREIESLLQAYDEADDILHKLDHPAGETSDRLLGQRVSHYQILEKLGGGGMGIVYKAHDTRLDRTVALKFLPPHLSLNAEANARFIHEAKAASALDHVNICTIYDIGETDDGRLFIAMAYYAGETLKAKIARGPLPLDEALDYVAQVAQGLERAHEAGIIHRDIKPANVMVTDRGRVKIVDFGLAKVADLQLTQTGTTLGTAAYMSPEQTHRPSVDHPNDLW